MRSSTGASVCIVSKLVDVHSSFSTSIVARDVIGNCRWGRFGRLLKGNGPGDLGVPADDGNWCERFLISTVSLFHMWRVLPGGAARYEAWDKA